MGNKVFKSKKQENYVNDVSKYSHCVECIECDIEQETFNQIMKDIDYTFYFKKIDEVKIL
jgi:hypothetical protein